MRLKGIFARNVRKTMLFSALLCCASTVCAKHMLETTNPNAALEALHLDWLDPSVSPYENFFNYANGQWQKQNPIPPEYASWGTFYILQKKVQTIVHNMLIKAANDKQVKPGSIEQKIGDFYFSGMDEDSINKLGISPLQSEFEQINQINTVNDLQRVLTSLQQIGVSTGFTFGSMQDFTNSENMIGVAFQDGLTLPDRDYYLKEDKKFKQVRSAYMHYLVNMFELLGDSPAQAVAASKVVMHIETTMAKASMTKVAQRDPKAIYHMMNVAQLDAVSPNFSWKQYFTSIGHPEIEHINLGTPDFFKKWNALLKTVSIHDWKIYLRWHLLESFAPYLSKPFVDQHFQMSSALTGTKKILPRWLRVVNTENGALGFAIGKLYVARYFPPSSKKAVIQIVNNIRKALRNDLQTLRWMTPATRAAAIKKLDLMGERVGYPDKWWDYSALVVDRGSYVLNVKHASAFLIKRDNNKIGKPIDKTEWAMTPQTVNAYYDSSMNNINLPAGILQPPFFDPKAPAAVNYGALGFVVGHEMTHGFDDQGSKFDGHGNLKNWWTADDLMKFKQATQCISAQFSDYKVDGLSLQGDLVVGEATADLGGLILALHAFQDSNAFKTAKTFHGVTPAQQFFLGAAHVWAANVRPEQARNLATIDPHPPMMYRVNGTLANMPQFQSAFSVPNLSKMVNTNRCVIW